MPSSGSSVKGHKTQRTGTQRRTPQAPGSQSENKFHSLVWLQPCLQDHSRKNSPRTVAKGPSQSWINKRGEKEIWLHFHLSPGKSEQNTNFHSEMYADPFYCFFLFPFHFSYLFWVWSFRWELLTRVKSMNLKHEKWERNKRFLFLPDGVEFKYLTTCLAIKVWTQPRKASSLLFPLHVLLKAV